MDNIPEMNDRNQRRTTVTRRAISCRTTSSTHSQKLVLSNVGSSAKGCLRAALDNVPSPNTAWGRPNRRVYRSAKSASFINCNANSVRSVGLLANTALAAVIRSLTTTGRTIRPPQFAPANQLQNELIFARHQQHTSRKCRLPYALYLNRSMLFL